MFCQSKHRSRKNFEANLADILNSILNGLINLIFLDWPVEGQSFSTIGNNLVYKQIPRAFKGTFVNHRKL